MRFMVFVMGIWLCLPACKEESPPDEDVYTFASFTDHFPEASLPYQLTDTALLNNRDTQSLRMEELAAIMPDSVVSRAFPKNGKIKYIPLARIHAPEGETFYIVKSLEAKKPVAHLLVFDPDQQFAASTIFLQPDNDASTVQISSIDRSLGITRHTIREGRDETQEGRNVYAYDPGSRDFILVVLDNLDDRTDIINPIDTLPGTHNFAGDYIRDKRNFVSIRDGRTDRQLMAFVHTDRGSGSCTGELKGELLITSANTAVYHQGADPCVLHFRFRGNTVTLSEETGCGNHRGVNCPFQGSFTRKNKPAAKKSTSR